MLEGINGKKTELFVSDVTGNYFSYFANAIGENDEKIREKLRERYRKDLTIKKGIKLALDIFKEIQGNNFHLDRFEVSYVTKENAKVQRAEGEEIKNI